MNYDDDNDRDVYSNGNKSAEVSQDGYSATLYGPNGRFDIEGDRLKVDAWVTGHLSDD